MPVVQWVWNGEEGSMTARLPFYYRDESDHRYALRVDAIFERPTDSVLLVFGWRLCRSPMGWRVVKPMTLETGRQSFLDTYEPMEPPR